MARPPRLPLFGPRRRAINAGASANGTGPPDAVPSRRLWPTFLAGLVLAAAVVGILASSGVLRSGETPSSVEVDPLPTQTTTVPDGRDPDDAIAAARLGFPTFATKNTTRIGGSGPVENAAAVALATFPSSGESTGPTAVTIAPTESWPVALAAAVMSAPPISAPLLLAEPKGIGELTSQTLAALAPAGGPETTGIQVFTAGAVTPPSGFEVREIGGDSPAAIAAELARTHRALSDSDPAAFLIVSDADPAFAMPAAAWAARAGDPILIVGRDQIPPATRAFLSENPAVPVYLLGPETVISAAVERRLGRGGRPVTRIQGSDPVTNAIEFARFSDGRFGWNINDPGHGLVITRDSEPLNAAAAAPLSAAGTWGPLLLTTDQAVVPGPLRSFLLDIKPGYRDDPTRALYNHVWLVGDQQAIGVAQQGTLDQLAELERIGEPEPPAPEPAQEDESATGTGGRAGAGQSAKRGQAGNNQADDASDQEAGEQ